MDGTLVGAENIPNRAVVDAIDTAQRHGVHAGIVTGRMRHAVTNLIEHLHLTGPHVFHNGAEVADQNGTVLAVRGLDDTAVRALYDLAHSHPDVVGEFYADHAFYVTSVDVRSEPHWEILNARPEGALRSVEMLGDLGVRKATLTAFTADAARQMADAVTNLGLTAGTATSPQTPNLTYVNATCHGADKGHGVKACATHLSIPLAATVMIGDESNDLPAFAVAGTAIAMGQAAADVREAAHLVVPDVHHDGVAHALAFLTGKAVT